MTHLPDNSQPEGGVASPMDDEYQEPVLTDAVRFFYQRRVRLTLRSPAWL